MHGEIIERDECALRASGYVFKRLDSIERSVVGSPGSGNDPGRAAPLLHALKATLTPAGEA
jgi:hypothetical protein